MKKHIKVFPEHKSECCACTACLSSCSKKCISLTRDELGFQYPIVDESLCVECGVCLKVCPFLNVDKEADPTQCYASVNNDDGVRGQSSSGGVFNALARTIIEEGGIVFGAVFDKNWCVRHIWADTLDGIAPMMGSKYLQSEIGNSYSEVLGFLKDGRKVLFTGTPCQIAGLNHFLRKGYENLFTAEVICHGVPAPGVWKRYLEETFLRPKAGDEKIRFCTLIAEPMPTIVGIGFRNKRNGWKKFGFALQRASERGEQNTVLHSSSSIDTFYEPFAENPYMKAFLRNWSLRPSCYNCQAKGGRSNADLTIGDFWGIQKIPHLQDDDKGTSCVICRTSKGEAFMQRCTYIKSLSVQYGEIYGGNPSLESSVTHTPDERFFKKLIVRNDFYTTMRKVDNPTMIMKIIRLLMRVCNKIFNKINS